MTTFPQDTALPVERKYALTKIATGDYLLPSNDAQTIYRISSYTDGPTTGLEDWPRDKTVWILRQWAGVVGPGGYVDTSPESERWEEVACCIPTRREAINVALAR